MSERACTTNGSHINMTVYVAYNLFASKNKHALIPRAPNGTSVSMWQETRASSPCVRRSARCACTTTTTSGGGSSCERDHREHSRRWCSASADGPTVDQSTTTTVGIVGPQMLIRIKMVFPARPRQIYSTVWLAVVPSRPRQRVVVLSGHDHHKHRQLVGVLTYF